MSSTAIPGQGAPVHQLAIREVFDHLSQRERLYAHHLSKAAWHGARIVMRQISPESTLIFDLILELHRSCQGQWSDLVGDGGATETELSAFLDYAALFLSNLGNFVSTFEDVGIKILPALSARAFYRLAKASSKATAIFNEVAAPMLSPDPSRFGYPGSTTQFGYYPGAARLAPDEIILVSEVLKDHRIEPENTRMTKVADTNHERVIRVLQASTDNRLLETWDDVDGLGTSVRLEGGDHAEELSKICASLLEAREYCANEKQTSIIDLYIDNFRTGSLTKQWVTDKAPRIETIFGFVGPYDDPHGDRAEWESTVCISDPIDSLSFKNLVEKSDDFIRLLPWAVLGLNAGKGPFEKETFEAPDFASVHALASCSSIVWRDHNLPRGSNDTSEAQCCKILDVANRINEENDQASPCPFIHHSEKGRFKECVYSIKNITTAVRELGHGTGKLLTETSPGNFNFDQENLPDNPLTGERVSTWYQLGQTWTSVFGSIAVSVEECRAEAISLFLMDNKELLSLFGCDDTSPIRPDNLLYNTYLYLAVQGLQSLDYYNIEERTWGEADREGQFAILNHLLSDGGGVVAIEHDLETLTVRVDRSKLLSHGKPSLGRLISRLHIWRCIADFESCRKFWGVVSAVSAEHEAWKRVVCAHRGPRWKFVQANTFLQNGEVTLRTYEGSNEGLIQSWAERGV